MSGKRKFELNYEVSIPDVPKSAATLHLWTPFPIDSHYQRIHSIDVQTDIEYEVNFESRYGNAILHASIPATHSTPIEISIRVIATRYEWSMGQAISQSKMTSSNFNDQSLIFKRQLSENRHIVFNQDIQNMAQRFKQESSNTLTLARSIYDHVLSTMEYDKTGDGWGKGDSAFACAIGKGNCTDFHSLFLAIARASGLPAQFEIGVAFPRDMQQGDITMFKCGYHCWATFFVQDIGWIPVDCSEAAQHENLQDYYFGNIDENRFLLSRGRDIDLVPIQRGDVQNFFTEPYVETENGTTVYCEKKLNFRYL